MSDKVRVLVVDDSALMRKLIPAILARDPSIEVVGTAMDGAFALKKIEELRPDVVTLDLEMPRMTGLELTKRIRQDQKLADIPVILLTSLASKEDKERGVEAGANAYFVKSSSFDQANLLEVVKRLI